MTLQICGISTVKADTEELQMNGGGYLLRIESLPKQNFAVNFIVK